MNNPGYYGSSDTYKQAMEGKPPNKDNQNTGTNFMGRSLGNWHADPSMYLKNKDDFMGHHVSSNTTNQYLQPKIISQRSTNFIANDLMFKDQQASNF